MTDEAPQPAVNVGAEDQQWAAALSTLDTGTGFHRLLLDGGRISLTLCRGDARSTLSQQKLLADCVYLGADFEDAAALGALVKCCKRGTRLHYASALGAPDSNATLALSAQGFRATAALQWVFDPAWPIQRSRQWPRPVWSRPQHCTVIGAGISGASVARALALRGWQVRVLDGQGQPAGGASGLPAGLVSPLPSEDNGPVSQLTRSGCALMRQHANALLVRGQDWDASGAWRNRTDPPAGLAAGAPQWIPEAFWLKPEALVRAWLNTAGIAFTGHTRIHHIARDEQEWVCLDEDGREQARSSAVVVASALDAARLLVTADPAPSMREAFARLHPRYGAVSIGNATGLPAFPAQPVQGHGNFLPSVPLDPKLSQSWLAGAGFDARSDTDTQAQHRANQARLARYLPEVAAALAPQFDAAQVQLWQNQRCVSHDRLPLVGAVQATPDASLWISAAMGARGLTLAALCAELLVAQMHGEPLPVPARLAKLVDTQRLQRKMA